jgi:hypothetical protein
MLSTMTLDWPHPRPRVLRQRKRLILQRYEVRIDGSHRGAFEAQVDAVHSANIAQHEHPSAIISVTDRSTGRLVVELAPQANTAAEMVQIVPNRCDMGEQTGHIMQYAPKSFRALHERILIEIARIPSREL